MVVRIRFGKGAAIAQKPRKNQRLALAVGALMTPMAVMVLALGLWCLAAGLNWSNDFFIAGGLFSHWQVWVAAAVALQVCARLLQGYGTAAETTTPVVRPHGDPQAGTRAV